MYAVKLTMPILGTFTLNARHKTYEAAEASIARMRKHNGKSVKREIIEVV
jgi:hypothetical protein